MQRTDKIDIDNGSFPLARDVLRVLAKTDLASSYIGAFFVITGRTFGWHDPGFEKEQRVKKKKKKKVEACIRSSCFEEFTGLPETKVSTLTRGLGIWLRMGAKIGRRSYPPPASTGMNALCEVDVHSL